MIPPPPGVGAFQFVVVASLRAAQLIRGCLPRVDGAHKASVTAQLEVSEGKVTAVFRAPDATSVEVTPAAVATALPPEPSRT